jgi:hypothetical protein
MDMVKVKAGSFQEISWRGSTYTKDADGNLTMPADALDWLESVAFPPTRRGGVSAKMVFERLPQEPAILR